MLGTVQEPREFEVEYQCVKCGTYSGHIYFGDRCATCTRYLNSRFTGHWDVDLGLIAITCNFCGYVWYMKPFDTLTFTPYEAEPPPAPAKKKWWRRA